MNYKWILSALLFFLLSGNALAASEGEALARVDACKAALTNMSIEDFEKGQNSDVLKTCQETYMSDDLSVQVLAMTMGKPFYSALEVVQGITGRDHGFEENDSIFTMFGPLHAILDAANWAFTYIFAFLAFAIVGSQFLKWGKGDDKVEFKQWLGHHGSVMGISGILIIPVVGWMSTAQFIIISIVAGVLFLTKYAITLLFLGAFFGENVSLIAEEATPVIEGNFESTVMNYQCDIQRRESMIKELISAAGISDKDTLIADPLYSCLTSPTVAPDSDIFGKLVNDGVTPSIEVTLPSLAQTERCAINNADYMKTLGMSEISECGSARLIFSNTEDGKFDEQLNLLKGIFLKSSVQNAARSIALNINEFVCRKSIFKTEPGTEMSSDLCMTPVINQDAYNYVWLTEPKTQVEYLARQSLPLSSSSAKQMRKDVMKSQTNLIAAVLADTQAVFQLAKNTFEKKAGGDIEAGEDDVDRTVGRIRRGAWMAGGLYFGSIDDDAENQEVIDYLSTAYSVTGTIPTSTIITGALNYSDFNEIFFPKKLRDDGANNFFILPSVGLYWDQIDCWVSQADCSASTLNPFTYMSRTGVDLIFHSVIGYITSTGLERIAKKFQIIYGKSRLMLADVYAEVSLLYLIIGLTLSFFIPLVFVLKLVSILFSWLYDMLKELMGLQLVLAFSPLSAMSQGMFQSDLKLAFHRMMGLSLYFLFVVIAIILSFVSFSFLFAVNVLIVGALAYATGLGDAVHSIESMVYRTIFDIFIVIILYLEARECSKLLEKLPQGMAQHFGLAVTPDNSAFENMLSRLRDNVMPGVGNALASSPSFISGLFK
ncbi:MAG: hypothetical protein CL840_04045 [Crocinitomicaceae bacterium]|nr:hypothetical protein [Crocinitomicaceae bacterium]|tara:strand:+ start:1691 stop:4171 length:2481 start_codon:yes stop_codon:yes gene_type:complete